MFEVERFVATCRAALEEASPQAAVKEVVERAVSRPGEVERALGTPQRAEIGTLHRSSELTILKIIWAPGMSIYPHDHRMWAVIGLYGGREENVFYRRVPQGLAQVRGRRLDVSETAALGPAVIHAVTNPLDRYTGAIHVYGGDFFAVTRSEWDPETWQEHPYDVEKATRLFTEVNERGRACARSAES